MPAAVQQTQKIRITDIHCPQCGAPAKFDIIQQKYLCGYCGGKVEIGEAQRQKYGFRKLQSEKLKSSVRQFQLVSASCSGCGATVVFEENEALSNCAFCGRSLVRKDYLDTEGLPENVIPFAVAEGEAKDLLSSWCQKNRSKPESRHLMKKIDELKGFYLPYELVRGPVHMKVSRMDGGNSYHCEGFINDEFVNRSRQLDNLLLDGMEPFDLENLTEFDFAYVAGHRVKISDISDEELAKRVVEETGTSYVPSVKKTLETNKIDVEADVRSAIRLPVLLPVYYLCDGELMAAVNGQTGKVSVRAEKESHFYFLPWWIKALLATLLTVCIVYGGLRTFGMPAQESFFLTGMLALVFVIIMLCLYSDTTRNAFSVESGREIFTSGEKTFKREQGKLVQNDSILMRKVVEPVFFEDIEGEVRPVLLRFTSPLRILKVALVSLCVLFLPVIIALFLNGFNFSMLELGGSAVWFCIMVPVIPVYILKFESVELYERPWIYIFNKKGKPKRYKKKYRFKITKPMAKDILRAVFVPPASLAVWFAILCFFVMCYLTAFGFDS